MNEAAPQRQLTLLQTSSIIVGTVIGSGVFISLPIAAGIAGSTGMHVLIWFLGGLVWIPQVFVLAEMGTAFPIQGGGYYYLNKAGSPFLAFLYTWTAFLTSDTPTLTILSLSAVSALSIFSAMLGNPIMARVLAAAVITAFALLHVRSVRFGGHSQVVLTAVKIIPLISIVGFGLWYLLAGTSNIAVPPEHAPDKGVFAILTAGISATLWSYAGFTNILYMAGEVKNPSRNIPLSLIGSLVFVMGGYTLIALCTSAIVPFPSLIGAKGEFVNPFLHIPLFAGSAGAIFAIAASTSMIGCLNASIMSQPRLEYAIARDGLFFKVFGHLHPRYLTPDFSILIQAGLAILMLFLGNIEQLLGYFTMSYALQNGLMYGAIFFLRKREDYHPTYKAPLWITMASVSIIIQLYIAFGTFLAYPLAGILSALFLIGSGFPIYRYYYVHRERQTHSVLSP
jgi:fructoselysine transporter